ncbi:hypothetical protein M011DRAFT_465499 [Sporormia fimetaria CBS 119925]|uniref:DUF1349-domain-containing protein n=1 Tax=Sporormia fimetaria CBS 119925 TaxID=1340428 RepID=A0A6A6VJ48_9PLEO|nr:hypothetical protein M011DRAFT_465499 [Sporormia fimetaria CBS 119925]
MSPHPTKTNTTPTFALTTPPGTDIWRKPPTRDDFNAPVHPSPLPTHTLTSFQRARLTFSLPAANTLQQYDQAGLILHLTHPTQKDKWIKTGIEFYNGKPYLSTVGTDRWSDWTVVPLEMGEGGDGKPRATIEARREKDQLGRSLWVYLVDGEERRPLREMNWVFADEEGWKVGVGGYVARPGKEGGELEARFEGLEVEVLEGGEGL